MSYQHWTRFQTTVDFDRGYLWSVPSNRQPENGFMNYDFPTLGKNWWTLVHWRKKWHWPMTLKFN